MYIRRSNAKHEGIYEQMLITSEKNYTLVCCKIWWQLNQEVHLKSKCNK